MNLSSIILCIILETILLFFYGCSTKGPTQVAGGSKVGNASLIQGRVFSPGGQPAADAQAILRPRQFIKDTSFASLSKDAANAMETRTDANGYFSFASVDIGEYNIEVNNQNHLAIVLTCSLALQNTQIDFPDTTLQPTGSLTGQISLYGITDTSAPAYVAIEGLDRIVKVDSNGGFNFPDLPVGQFQVKTIISVQGNNATGSMSFTIKPSEADTLDTLYVLPKVTRSGMRITAILHDSLLSAATIHDSVDFVFVRKPDTLKWSMATTPLTLTAQLMTTNGFGSGPLNTTKSQQAVVVQIDASHYQVTWPDIATNHGLSGIYLMGIIYNQGNVKRFIRVDNIIEGISGYTWGDVNPWAVILE